MHPRISQNVHNFTHWVINRYLGKIYFYQNCIKFDDWHWCKFMMFNSARCPFDFVHNLKAMSKGRFDLSSSNGYPVHWGFSYINTEVASGYFRSHSEIFPIELNVKFVLQFRSIVLPELEYRIWREAVSLYTRGTLFDFISKLYSHSHWLIVIQ